MSTEFCVGNHVCLREGLDPFMLSAAKRQGIHPDTVLPVQETEKVPCTTILGQEYIKAGYIPDHYRRHLIRGIGTTQRDTVGASQWITVNGTKFSSAFFRQASPSEVNRHAKSIL